jgi:hypothetical protein
MGQFTKFSEWEKTKYSQNERQDVEAAPGNAEIMAKIADLVSERKAHIKNKDDFQAQILEIEIKILKNELMNNELKEKRKHLMEAKALAESRRKEGRTNG